MAHIHSDVEWYVNLTAAASSLARHVRLVRCIRRVGLQGSLAGRVVPIPWGPLPIAYASIAPKELFLIVMVWGQHWRSCTVCFHFDNSDPLPF